MSKFMSIISLAVLLLGTTVVVSSANQEVTGTIVESGMGSIIMKQKGTSTNVRYHIGRKTVYSPSNYRAQVGDKVTLSFFEKPARNGQTMLAVSSLTLKEKDPNRKALKSPAKGIIEEVGRVMIRINYTAQKTSISMAKKRGYVLQPTGYVPTAGDHVVVEFETVINRWTQQQQQVITKITKK